MDADHGWLMPVPRTPWDLRRRHIWRSLREAGIGRDEARRARDPFVASWKPRLGPDYQPQLWTVAYLVPALDAADAQVRALGLRRACPRAGVGSSSPP